MLARDDAGVAFLNDDKALLASQVERLNVRFGIPLKIEFIS